MENNNNTPAFPEQNEPMKAHGTTDDSGNKEKYLRDSGKIEDLPASDEEMPKMNADAKSEDAETPDPGRSEQHRNA